MIAPQDLIDSRPLATSRRLPFPSWNGSPLKLAVTTSNGSGLVGFASIRRPIVSKSEAPRNADPMQLR